MPDVAPAHRAETDGVVITTPRRYDLRMLLHTRGREGRFRELQVHLARLAPGERVLDIGSGTGGFAIAAAKSVGSAGSVIGIDPSPEMVGHARAKARRARSAASFEVAAIESLPYPDASFDVVTISLVLHQLSSDGFHRGMVEARRVLRPGGRLLAIDMGGPQRPGRRTSHNPSGHGHAGGFDLERVAMFFDHLGFERLDDGPVDFRFAYLEDLRYVLARRGS